MRRRKLIGRAARLALLVSSGWATLLVACENGGKMTKEDLLSEGVGEGLGMIAGDPISGFLLSEVGKKLTHTTVKSMSEQTGDTQSPGPASEDRAREEDYQQYEKLKQLVEQAAEDVAKAEGGNKAAGTRVRKAMQDIKAAAQEVRKKILEVRSASDSI